MSKNSIIHDMRKKYHRQILKDVLRFDDKKNAWNNTDTSSRESIRNAAAIAEDMIKNTGANVGTSALNVQNVGKNFELATLSFIRDSFLKLSHLRPGKWDFSLGGKISEFNQYAHLVEIRKALKTNPALRAALGDYLVTPDIVIARFPESDKKINHGGFLIDSDENIAGETSLREQNNQEPILHASVSCKWTLRSDRSQNARTEGLNLIRNRKGRTPHIVIVVGEPMPSRMAALAYGTGDIDCVYHFALEELKKVADDNSEILNTLIAGRRLRDISDLPFDLAI